ncbi:hypothetical protein SCUP515_00224 [Seiridium cupressi]
MPSGVLARRTVPLGNTKGLVVEQSGDDAGSSSDSDDEGIPSISPNKLRSRTQPTLSIRRSPAKRPLAVEGGQLTRLSKKHKTSEPPKAPEKSRPPSSNGYPTPESSRTAPAQRVDGTSSSDANSVRASLEDEDDNSVDPGLIAMVNHACGNRRHAESSGRPFRDETGPEDDESVISDIDLDDHTGAEPEQILDEPELEDMDLSVEPTNQGFANHDQAVPLVQIRKPSELAGTGGSHELVGDQAVNDKSGGCLHGKELKPTQLLVHHAPAYDIYDNLGYPERKSATSELVTSKPFTSTMTDLHRTGSVRLKTKRINSSRQRPGPSPTTSQATEAGRVERTLTLPRQSVEPEAVDKLDDHSPRRSQYICTRSSVEDVPRESQISRNESPHKVTQGDHETASENNSNSGLGISGRGEARLHGYRRKAQYTIDNDDNLDHPSGSSVTISHDEELFVSSDDEDAEPSIHVATQFEQDVHQFRTHNHQDDDEPALFAAAATDSFVTIELSSTNIYKAKLLMKRLGWSAITKDWADHLTENYQPRTTPVKHLIRALERLERFVLAAPHAPPISDQNCFYREYDDVLKHLLVAIDGRIEYLRTKRLSFTYHTNPLNRDNDARQEVAIDLVRLVIPFVIRILGEAWELGGDVEDSFTEYTVQILAKLVGWLQKLYRPLLRELRIRPLNVGSSAKDVEAREALEPLLNKLQNILREAPQRLQAKEKSQLQAESARQYRLRRQQEIIQQQHLEAEAKKRRRREQNRTVAQAIRGEAASFQQMPDPALWRREEEVALCNHLQGAYDHQPPKLPKLATIAYLLGHSEDEIKHKSRGLLAVMWSRIHPGQDNQKLVDELMRQWD